MACRRRCTKTAERAVDYTLNRATPFVTAYERLLDFSTSGASMPHPLTTYRHGAKPYAFVTGATDGLLHSPNSSELELTAHA